MAGESGAYSVMVSSSLVNFFVVIRFTLIKNL